MVMIVEDKVRCLIQEFYQASQELHQTSMEKIECLIRRLNQTSDWSQKDEYADEIIKQLFGLIEMQDRLVRRLVKADEFVRLFDMS